MSTDIESKVVEMRFDNQQFESGVKTSLSTLDKLKAALNFSNSTKGIESVRKAASTLDFKETNTGLDAVFAKLNLMDIVGITAIQNLTNSAVNSLKGLIRELSGIDQVSAGWAKYNENLTATATIMNAVRKEGESEEEVLSRVKTEMDELMWYTDETSYNFTDMTSNIGKFTALGIPLHDATVAMMGIANAVASTGGGAQKATVAMYNFSQAMSKGYLALQDWNSISTVAGLNSVEFKQKLIDAAVEAGTVIQKNNEYIVKSTNDVISATGNFAESFRDKWVNQEVMMNAFTEYAGFTDNLYSQVLATGSTASELLADMDDSFGKRVFLMGQEARTFSDAIGAVKDAVSSGWLATMDLIVGDKVEATSFFTDLANAMWDTFASGAEVRNELLGTWKELGGRDDLIDSFWNLYEILDTIKGIGRAVINGILDPSAGKLTKITSVLKTLTDPLGNTLRLWKELGGLEDVARIFENLFSPLRAFTSAFRNVISKYIPKGETAFGYMAGKLTVFVRKIADLTEKMKAGSGHIKKYETFIRGLAAGFNLIKESIKFVINLVSRLLGFDGIPDLLGKTNDLIADGAEGIGNWLIDLNDAAEKGDVFNKALENTLGFFTRIKDAVVKAYTAVSDWVKKVYNFLDSNFNISGFFASVSNAFKTIKDFVLSLFEKDKDGNAAIKNWFKGLFTKKDEKEAETTLGTKLREVLSKIFSTETVNNILNIGKTTAFATFVIGFIKLLSNISKGVKEFKDKIKKFSVGEELNKFIFGDKISSVLDKIAGAFGDFSKKLKSDNLLKTVSTFAKAVAVLTAALYVLSIIPVDTLDDVLGALIVEMGSLVGVFAIVMNISKGFMKSFTDPKALAKAASGVVTAGKLLKQIAVSLLLLSVSLKLLSTIDREEMTNSIVGLAVIIAAIVILTKQAEKLADMENLEKVSWGLVAFAFSIGSLATSMAILSLIPADKLAAGGIALGVCVAAIVAFVKFTDKVKIDYSTSVAIVAMALAIQMLLGAILVLALAMTLIPNLTDNLGQAMLAVGAMLVLLTVLSHFVNDMGAPEVLASAGAMVILSYAVVQLSLAIALLAVFKDVGRMWSAVGAISAIAVLLTGLTYVLSLIDGSSILRVASALVVMSAGMLVMSLALGLIATLPANKIKNATTALVNMLKATGSVMGILGKIKIDNILKVASSVLIVSAAMIVMGLAMKTISKLNSKKLISSVIALGVMAAIIAGVMLIAKDVDNDSSALSILAMGAGLLLVARAIKKLAKIPAGTLWSIVGALTVLIAVLTVIGIFFGPQFATVLTAISAFNASITGMLLAVAAIALAGALFATSLALLVSTLGLLAAGGEDAANGIVAGMVVILNGIKDNGPLITEAFGTIIYAILMALAQGIADFIKGLSEGILLICDVIKTAAAPLSEAVISTLGEVGVGLIRGIGSLGSYVIAGLAALLDSVVRFFGALIDGIFGTHILEDYIVDGMGKLERGVRERILPDTIKAGEEAGAAAGGGFLSKFGHILDEGGESGGLNGTLERFTSGLGVGEESGSGIQNGVSKLLDGLGLDTKSFDIGFNAGKALDKGYGEALSEGTTVSNVSAQKYLDEIEENYKHGITDWSDEAKEAAKTVKKKVMAGYAISPAERALLIKYGQYFDEGFAAGMAKYEYKVKKAAEHVGETGLNTLKNYVQISSPSKVTKEFGKFYDLGFANGIFENTKSVVKSVLGLGEKTNSAFEGVMREAPKPATMLQNLFDIDADITPVIRPVVDTSGVSDGAKAISGILGNSGGQYLGSVSYGLSNTLARNKVSAGSGVTTPSAIPSTQSTTIENHFNITGDDPRAIAEEVSKIIQMQYERKDAVWA